MILNITVFLETLNSISEINFSSIEVNFVFAILGAVVGFLLSLSKDWYNSWRNSSKYRKLYGEYEGVYLAYLKYDKNLEKPYRCFELKRKQNEFIIKDGISVIGHANYDAKIVMNELSYNHGQGYYRHKKDPDGVTRFGFLEVQLADDEILVHETIFNKDHDQNADGFRWVKQNYDNKVEFLNKYKQIQKEKMAKQFDGEVINC